MSDQRDLACRCGGTYRLENRRTSDNGPKHQVSVCRDCGRLAAA